MSLRIGSLFTGYGGLERAILEVLGGAVAWHCEYEPPSKQTPRPTQAAARLLAYRHPDVPNLGDISAVDWSQVEPVNVLCGGFPCTDVSSAGLRLGLRPGTRSGLWERMAYAVASLRPDLVVIENVRGLLSAEAHSDLEPCPWCVGDDGSSALRALGAVLGDLAELGYDARWVGLRAADVGAPHGRFRVFIAAWPVADAERRGRDGRAGELRSGGGAEPAHCGGAAAHASCDGREGCEERHERQAGRIAAPQRDDADRRDHDASDADQGGWGTDLADLRAGQPDADWGPYGDAVRRWERLTRPAPAPTEPGTKGQPRLSPAFVEWMMGLPAGHVTAVPGLTRNEQLKMLGNGVVHQQAAAALRFLLADPR